MLEFLINVPLFHFEISSLYMIRTTECPLSMGLLFESVYVTIQKKEKEKKEQLIVVLVASIAAN